MKHQTVDSATGLPLVISRVEVVGVRAPLAREFRGSFYRMTHRATVIVRVHTADGIVGEAYVGDEDGALEEIAAIIKNEIEPRIVGLSGLSIERVWEQAYPATFDILRDRRLGLVAVAGIDAALWDAVGKSLDVPLWRLWGGYRDKVPLIAIGGYYKDALGPIEQEIADYKELGLAGVKFKVGGASPAEDAARVRAAREAAGDDFVIAVDANQGYTVREALEFAWQVEDLGLAWFEEPVMWHNDRRSLRDVRMRSKIPVTAGQSEYSPSGCRDLMETGSIDMLNFDSSWSGGPTVWLRAAAIAQSYDVTVGHHEEPQVASHLIASQAHGTYAECFHPDRDPFWWDLIETPREIKDGFLTLPEGPGLGWTLDEDYIARNHYEL